jgi:hypothetical protein
VELATFQVLLQQPKQITSCGVILRHTVHPMRHMSDTEFLLLQTSGPSTLMPVLLK